MARMEIPSGQSVPSVAASPGQWRGSSTSVPVFLRSLVENGCIVGLGQSDFASVDDIPTGFSEERRGTQGRSLIEQQVHQEASS